MHIKQVKLICFSPTGTTQKTLKGIAKGMAIDPVEPIDLTLVKNEQQALASFSDELVIMGAPVYGGRLPVEAVTRFRQLKADNTLAVLVVLYGNREFEDALLELKNLTRELGFIPLAAAAFIGEHSFATNQLPIANGRPDSQDIEKAMAFGAKIKDKITTLQSPEDLRDLDVPGRFPYESQVRTMTVAPVSQTDMCSMCGTCASVCPTGAITVDEIVSTKAEQCIRCSACIKSCPEDARGWEDKMMKEIAKWLNENCSERKEPEFFGVTG